MSSAAAARRGQRATTRHDGRGVLANEPVPEPVPGPERSTGVSARTGDGDGRADGSVDAVDAPAAAGVDVRDLGGDPVGEADVGLSGSVPSVGVVDGPCGRR